MTIAIAPDMVATVTLGKGSGLATVKAIVSDEPMLL
jgi:hypothetical protein